MPVFRLTDELIFPPPSLAEPDGLLAVGGDLTPERLLLAYSMGIFPWFNDGDPPLWWSPDPRCVLNPKGVKISRSLAKVLRKGVFDVTFDKAFGQVISACASLRRKTGEGTWITPKMEEAYLRLFALGYAHSVECWCDGALAGGLYGVSLGRCFFGESMFHRVRDASKVAFVALSRETERQGYELIDCQITNPHLISLGAEEIPRGTFLKRLAEGVGLAFSQEPSGSFGGR